MTPAVISLAPAFKVLVLLALCFAPGYALLLPFRRSLPSDWSLVLCLSAGLSLASAPLLLYLATSLGFALSTTFLAACLVLTSALAVADSLLRFTRWLKDSGHRFDLALVLLGLIFVATLAARMAAVRGLAFPLWTDSLHHTLITQIISETGRLPASYRPYAPIDSFTYHFGFHTLAAWYHLLTGTPVPRSVVVVGQAVNALAVLTTYALALRLTGRRSGALAAALIVGLLSQMPAQFVNWSRYPQLEGQVVLPVVILLTMDSLERERPNRLWLLAGLAAAGLFLTHNRIFLFYGAFAAIYLASRMIAVRKNWRALARQVLLAGAIAGVFLLVDSLWLIRFFGGFGGRVAKVVIDGYQPSQAGVYFDFTPIDLFRYGMWPPDLALAAGGAVLATVRRNWKLHLLILWFLSLFAMANVHRLGIYPLFSNLIVNMFLCLPISILAGYLAGECARWVYAALLHHRPRLRLAAFWASGALAVSAAAVGALYTIGITAPDNVFVRPADLQAMAWIRENTPPQALFHSETHFWTPVVCHGLDAGYWIPLLAGRQATVPIQTYTSDGTPAQIDLINQRARDLVDASSAPELGELLADYRVDYYYVGARRSDFDPGPFLSDTAHFRLVYNKDGVWIFAVIQSVG
ncbi:MAG: hypothetical protein NTU91_12360 [Chloroflexi bacterium]|nr:hypothetical protein [Chloroflexota bacterium]